MRRSYRQHRVALLVRVRRMLRNWGVDLGKWEISGVLELSTPKLLLDVARDQADAVGIELAQMGWSVCGEQLSDGRRRITAVFYGI